MLERFCESASFEERAMSRGLSCLRCAFAAIVTAESVMPRESFERVLPVQGAIISASRGTVGPSGSASLTVYMISRPVISSTLLTKLSAVPKRVEVE
jgi:hypothetical protein